MYKWNTIVWPLVTRPVNTLLIYNLVDGLPCVFQNDLRRSAKSSADPAATGDVPMISQNARPPGPYAVPEVLLRYLSVGADGTPLLTTITPDMVDRTGYSDWSSDDDYVDMPDERTRRRRQRNSAKSS